VQRGAMILAAERIAIEQPQPALLARADEELAAAIVERDRRRVDVEIAPPQPVRVRRAEVVGELQLLLVVELHADDAVAEPAVQRIELRVAGAEVDRAFGIDRRAAAAPQAAARGNERAGAARREVERVERVGQAAAALRRRGVDDAVVQLSAYGLPPPGMNFSGGATSCRPRALTCRSRPSHDTA
jgi:hypothetical protein